MGHNNPLIQVQNFYGYTIANTRANTMSQPFVLKDSYGMFGELQLDPMRHTVEVRFSRHLNAHAHCINVQDSEGRTLFFTDSFNAHDWAQNRDTVVAYLAAHAKLYPI